MRRSIKSDLQHFRRPPAVGIGEGGEPADRAQAPAAELNFTDQADPGDHDALVAAAVKVGLDATTAREVLASDGYADQVRVEEAL